MDWQPIETAPNNTSILAWMEGFEEHSGTTWRRYGYALIVLHKGETSEFTMTAAMDRIIGPDRMRHRYASLAPTHWQPLGEPPK